MSQTIKTTVSLSNAMLREVDTACAELGMSRSQLIPVALDKFFSLRHRQKLLAKINAASADDETAEEAARSERVLQIYRMSIEDTW